MLLGQALVTALSILAKDKDKGKNAETANAESSGSATPTPDPSSVPSESPSPNGETGSSDAIGGIIDFLFANPIIIAVVAGFIGIGYGWKQLRQYNAERGKATPPLGFIIKRALRFAFKEDKAPVFRRIPGLGWFRWTYMYLILVVGTIFLYLMGLHDLLIGSAVLSLIIWWRARRVFATRHGILMQMFNVAAADFRYPKGAELNPWGYINVTQWIDMYRPGQTVITFPAGFKSEDLTARERFERNFSGSVSDENSFTYEWKSAQNRVIASPTPYLPSTAKYPGYDDHPWNEFPLGITWGGEEAVWPVQTCPHILVAGPTGSGKSVLQRTILLHALQSPDWRIIGIDPKMVELGPYKDHKNVLKIATQLEEAAALLESAENEMKRRYEEMTQYGVNHFKDLPPEPETGQPLPALMVMVDETYALLAPEGIKSDEGKERDALHARCTVLIGSIARLGRAAGVHLVLATQRPDAKVIPGETRSNLDARVACARMDTTPSLMVLDSDHATRLPLIKGRSVLRLGGEVKEFQGYFLPIEDVDGVVQQGLARNLAKRDGTPLPPGAEDHGDEHDRHTPSAPVGAAPVAAAAAAAGGGLKGWWARRAAAAQQADQKFVQSGTSPDQGAFDPSVGVNAQTSGAVDDRLRHDLDTARWAGEGSGWDEDDIPVPPAQFPVSDEVEEGDGFDEQYWGPSSVDASAPFPAGPQSSSPVASNAGSSGMPVIPVDEVDEFNIDELLNGYGESPTVGERPALVPIRIPVRAEVPSHSEGFSHPVSTPVVPAPAAPAPAAVEVPVSDTSAGPAAPGPAPRQFPAVPPAGGLPVTRPGSPLPTRPGREPRPRAQFPPPPKS